ncbi:MAG TPA: hypothetical protein VLZ77_17515, partial [Acidimicrobiales bacterium]|nr:hypothetical protein [Acidimicrobiales bacterium]
PERRTAPRRQRERSRSEVRRSGLAGPGRRRRSLPPITVALAVSATVALFEGATLVTGFLTPPGPSSSTPPASVAVVARSQAASITFDRTGGWLADDGDGTVRHFNPATGAALGRPIAVGGRPISIVSGFGRVWVADGAGSEVWRINPVTRKVVGGPLPVPQDPVSLAAGDGGIWVASLLAGTVSLLDPRTGDLEASVALPDGAVRITVGPGGVWVSGQTDTMTRIDPRPVGDSLRWRTVRVGQGPIGVGGGDGAVWVANVQSGTVSRVDPATVRVTATYRVAGAAGAPADPEMVAVWQDRLWVANGQQGVVVAIDPGTGRQVGGAVTLPGVIRQLVLDPSGGLWGATANPGTVVRFH